MVEHGRSGFLAPIGEVGALADGLSSLARDPDLAGRFGTFGAADVRTRFSLARMADDLEAVYRRGRSR